MGIGEKNRKDPAMAWKQKAEALNKQGCLGGQLFVQSEWTKLTCYFDYFYWRCEVPCHSNQMDSLNLNVSENGRGRKYIRGAFQLIIHLKWEEIFAQLLTQRPLYGLFKCEPKLWVRRYFYTRNGSVLGVTDGQS